MAKFVLQPCKVLATSFVPLNEGAIECDFKTLMDLVAVREDPAHLAKIKALKIGSFIGKSQVTKGMVNFLLINRNNGPSFEWIDDKDPTFKSRVLSVYRVELAQWGGSAVEI